MKFGLDQINNIVEKTAAETLPYQDCIIVGDNSSGKSLLLKKFIETIKVNHDIYFIDAVNRIFDTKKIIRSGKKPAYKKSIHRYSYKSLQTE